MTYAVVATFVELSAVAGVGAVAVVVNCGESFGANVPRVELRSVPFSVMAGADTV